MTEPALKSKVELSMTFDTSQSILIHPEGADLSEDHYCSICHDIAVSPSILYCFHLICMKCVSKCQDLSHCPRCLEELFRPPLQVHFRITKRDAVFLEQVACPYSSRGCKEVSTIISLRDHLLTCAHADVICPLCDNPLIRSHLDAHIDRNCECRIVPCPKCDAKLKHKDMNDHHRLQHHFCKPCGVTFDKGDPEHSLVDCLVCGDFIPACQMSKHYVEAENPALHNTQLILGQQALSDQAQLAHIQSQLTRYTALRKTRLPNALARFNSKTTAPCLKTAYQCTQLIKHLPHCLEAAVIDGEVSTWVHQWTFLTHASITQGSLRLGVAHAGAHCLMGTGVDMPYTLQTSASRTAMVLDADQGILALFDVTNSPAPPFSEAPSRYLRLPLLGHYRPAVVLASAGDAVCVLAHERLDDPLVKRFREHVQSLPGPSHFWEGTQTLDARDTDTQEKRTCPLVHGSHRWVLGLKEVGQGVEVRVASTSTTECRSVHVSPTSPSDKGPQASWRLNNGDRLYVTLDLDVGSASFTPNLDEGRRVEIDSLPSYPVSLEVETGGLVEILEYDDTSTPTPCTQTDITSPLDLSLSLDADIPHSPFLVATLCPGGLQLTKQLPRCPELVRLGDPCPCRIRLQGGGFRIGSMLLVEGSQPCLCVPCDADDTSLNLSIPTVSLPGDELTVTVDHTDELQPRMHFMLGGARATYPLQPHHTPVLVLTELGSSVCIIRSSGVDVQNDSVVTEPSTVHVEWIEHVVPSPLARSLTLSVNQPFVYTFRGKTVEQVLKDWNYSARVRGDHPKIDTLSLLSESPTGLDVSTHYCTLISKRVFRADPLQRTRVEGRFTSISGKKRSGTQQGNSLYVGFVALNEDRKNVFRHNVNALSPVATLLEDTSVGQHEMVISDGRGWFDCPLTSSCVVFNANEDFSDIPNFKYTSFGYLGTNIKSIEPLNPDDTCGPARILFTDPLRPQDVFPKGTGVRLHRSGGTYMYQHSGCVSTDSSVFPPSPKWVSGTWSDVVSRDCPVMKSDDKWWINCPYYRVLLLVNYRQHAREDQGEMFGGYTEPPSSTRLEWVHVTVKPSLATE